MTTETEGENNKDIMIPAKWSKDLETEIKKTDN